MHLIIDRDVNNDKKSLDQSSPEIFFCKTNHQDAEVCVDFVGSGFGSGSMNQPSGNSSILPPLVRPGHLYSTVLMPRCLSHRIGCGCGWQRQKEDTLKPSQRQKVRGDLGIEKSHVWIDDNTTWHLSQATGLEDEWYCLHYIAPLLYCNVELENGGPPWNEGDSELLGNYFMFMFLASSVISGRFVEYQPIIHIQVPKIEVLFQYYLLCPHPKGWFTSGTNAKKVDFPAGNILNEGVDVSHKKWGVESCLVSSPNGFPFFLFAKFVLLLPSFLHMDTRTPRPPDGISPKH